EGPCGQRRAACGRIGGHRRAVDPASLRDRGAPSPIAKRRLFGIDRSGPPPAATLAGAPLRPWTIPNLIGYARLAAIPVFLVVALGLSRYGLRHGVELHINWFGRVGVAPTMAAPFFAILGLHTVALVMLYCGLALSIAATVLYVRDGLAQIKAGKASSSA